MEKPKSRSRPRPDKPPLKRGKGFVRSADKMRMQLVFHDWKKNGFKSLGKSMIRHGYSPKSEPHDMTKSMTWQQIMKEAMPDSFLMEKHVELLNARKTEIVESVEFNEETGLNEKVKKLVDLGPDVQAVGKGLEMAYKLKGSFNVKDDGEGSRPANSTIYNLFYKPEIRNSVKQLEAALTKQLYGEPLKDDDGTIPENFGGSSTTPYDDTSNDVGRGEVDNGDSGEDDGTSGKDE